MGISSYTAEQTSQAAAILRDLGTPCLIHQPRYNMLDRWIEDGLLDVLNTEGIGCIVYSPLAQGILTNKYLEGVPADSRAGKAQGRFGWDDRLKANIDKVHKLNQLAQSRGQTMAQLAIAWVLRHPNMT